jgi:predicted transcriptional regulator
MPPTLVSQGTERKAAETEVLSLLKASHDPQRVKDIVEKLQLDETTVLRAIFRLAASGRILLDQNLTISRT